MRKFFVMLLVLCAPVSTAAIAQHGGTDAEQKACARDVSRFCRKLMDQGDLVVLSCLKENRPKLTSTCNKVLLSHGQ